MAVTAPVNWRDSKEHRRLIANAVNGILDGHTNNAGEVTLNPTPSTTTVVNDARAGVDSVILFMPLTYNAAQEISTMYVSSRGAGTFTITHSNNENEDLDFAYVLCGTGRAIA